MVDPIVRRANAASSKEVMEQLPPAAQTAETVSNAAFVIQIVNGLDMLLTAFGVVPPGALPIVVNGVIAIGAGVTQWWAKRKQVKVAYFTPPPGSSF